MGRPAWSAIACPMVSARSPGEERAGDALRDRAVEQALGLTHGEHGGDHACPGRLAEHGDVGGVAAEALDVVLDPGQGGHRVEQAAVGGGAGGLGEALHPEAVVERDEDRAALRERGPVVAGLTAGAEHVGAAVDPDQDRQPGGPGRGSRRYREPVAGGGRGRAGLAAFGRHLRLRRGRAELGRLADAVPRGRRFRGLEPERADRGLGERDAAEDRDTLLDSPPDPAGAGGDHRIGWRHGRPPAASMERQGLFLRL